MKLKKIKGKIFSVIESSDRGNIYNKIFNIFIITLIQFKVSL